MPSSPLIALEQVFSRGRAPDFLQVVVWGLAVTVVLVAAEYARRSSSNR